jgi:hypothetical protein
VLPIEPIDVPTPVPADRLQQTDGQRYRPGHPAIAWSNGDLD